MMDSQNASFSKKKSMKWVLAIIVALTLTLTFSALAFADDVQKTAISSQTQFVLDGKAVTFDVAYNIENSNYIQLRSVAQTLNGTKSQFNVYWDDALKQAVIETGAPYTGIPPAAGVPLSSTPSTAQIKGENTYTVAPGNDAVITIQGTPGVEYRITYTTPKGNVSTAEGLTAKTADSSGNVRWEWKIGTNTSAGTGTIIIVGADGSVFYSELEIL